MHSNQSTSSLEKPNS